MQSLRLSAATKASADPASMNEEKAKEGFMFIMGLRKEESEQEVERNTIMQRFLS